MVAGLIWWNVSYCHHCHHSQNKSLVWLFSLFWLFLFNCLFPLFTTVGCLDLLHAFRGSVRHILTITIQLRLHNLRPFFSREYVSFIKSWRYHWMQVFVLEVTTHLTKRNPNKKLTQKSAITDSYNRQYLFEWLIHRICFDFRATAVVRISCT